MPKKTPTPYSFGPGHVQDSETIRVISQIDSLVDAGEIASNVMKWTRKDGSWNSFSIEWSAVRLWLTTKPQTELCILGPDGEALVVSRTGHAEEALDGTVQGPQGRGPLRDLRWIGGHLYASGMSRQVYRREGVGIWRHRDEGTVLALGSKTVAGFNSIDGLTEEDFHAVGFGGEIWRCLKGSWHRVESPTNVVLNRVKVVRDGLAYACGQEGVLLRGYGEEWEQIDHSSMEEDLWDAEWFGDSIYFAHDDGLYVLTDGDELEPVKFGIRGTVTCRHLHANDGVLLSSGPKNVLWTSDGKTWQDITP
jgi:hypothetical protein